MSRSDAPAGGAENLPQEKPRRFYVPQLDGLRFLAFLLVFIHHSPRWSQLLPPSWLPRKALVFVEGFGWFGVDLFLVLSAFLITSLLLLEYERHRSISLRGFYMRRILRIWPLYYLMCTLGFFVLPGLNLFAVPWRSPEHAQLMKDHLLPYYTLFGNFSMGVRGTPIVRPLGHMWTVTLEEQFYLVWPLILSLMLRTRRIILWLFLGTLLVGTVSLRLGLASHLHHPYIWTNTFTRLDPLVIGISLALLRFARPAKAGWLVPTLKLLLGVGVVGTIAAGPVIEAQTKNLAWQLLATATGFGLILDAVLMQGRNPFAWLLSRRLLVWLGKLTYGLYVYHVLGLQLGAEVVAYLQKRQLVASPAVVTQMLGIVSLLLTVAIAALSYRLFESFFLRLKDRWSRVKSRPVET